MRKYIFITFVEIHFSLKGDVQQRLVQKQQNVIVIFMFCFERKTYTIKNNVKCHKKLYLCLRVPPI